MRKSDIYRWAAEILTEGHCTYYGSALDRAGQPNPGGSDSPLQDSFDVYFEGILSWWDTCNPADDDISIQVLALCLMADIVADNK